MAENDNILRTRLEVDDAGYQSQIQSQFVAPSEKAASRVSEEFAKIVSEARKANGALKNSAEQLKTANEKATASLRAANPNFADAYKRGFDDLIARARKAKEVAENFASTNLNAGKFTPLAQSASVVSTRITQLLNDIKRLRSESAKPENAGYFNTLTAQIRGSEKELATLEAKTKRFRTGGSGGSGGGNGDLNQVVGAAGGSLPLIGGVASAAAIAGPAAAAAAAILTAVSAVKELVSVGSSLTQQSIQLAANFEETTNSVAVFAGSTRLAREELRAMDEVALSTNGLRLESAEKGYQQLRALGFEAKLTRDLIQGLGKQRILSGSTDEDVNRVIVNLTQLRGDASNATRDIKEIIRAIPSIRNTFRDAFKTTNSGELKALLESNPDEFFSKFAAALASTKEAQAGFNISLEKGKDAFVEAGRAFGEPLLDPLTESVKDLTGFVRENKDVLKDWGETFGDVLRGINALAKGISSIANLGGGKVGEGIKLAGRGALAAGTLGLSEAGFGAVNSLSALGQLQKERDFAALSPTQQLAQRFPGAANAFNSSNNTVDFSRLGASKEELDAERSQREIKDEEAEERRLKKEEEVLTARAKLIDKRREVALAGISQRLDENKALASLNSIGRNPVEAIRENTRLEIKALEEQKIARDNFTRQAIAAQTPEEIKKGEKFAELSQSNAAEQAKLDSQIIIARVNDRKAETEEIRRQASVVSKLRDETRDFLITASDAARDNNPFLKIFGDAETVVKRFEERFRNFGGNFAREMAKVELSKLAADAGQSRYNAGSQALRFDQERRGLQNFDERKSVDFSQALDRIKAQVDNLSQNSELNKEIRDLTRRPGFEVDQNREKISDALEQLRKISSIRSEGTGIYGEDVLAQAVANVINPVKDIGTDRQTALQLNSALVEANKTRIKANDQKLTDAIDSQKFIEDQRRDATERLSLAKNAQGLTKTQLNDEILAITGELGAGNLNPALRKARIDALKDGSELKRSQEREALDAVKAVAAIMTKIDGKITEKGLAVDFSDQPLVNLEVRPGLDLNSNGELPAKASNADTARQMALKGFNPFGG